MVRSLRSAQAIKVICRQHGQVAKAIYQPEERKEWVAIKEQIVSKDGQFKQVRIAIKVESFKDNFSKNKKKNRLQEQKGIDITPLMLGKIPFGKLKADRDTDLVKRELEAWNLSTEGAGETSFSRG